MHRRSNSFCRLKRSKARQPQPSNNQMQSISINRTFRRPQKARGQQGTEQKDNSVHEFNVCVVSDSEEDRRYG